MTLSFEEKRFIEQIRDIENTSPSQVDAGQLNTELAPGVDSFEKKLLERAHRYKSLLTPSVEIDRACKIHKRIVFILSMLVAILGGIAVQQTVDSVGTTINIYWLMLLLLGANSLSLGLWLVSIINIRSNGESQGLVNSILQKLPRLPIFQSSATQGICDKTWGKIHYGGPHGRWKIYSLTHQLWAIYLSAGSLVFLLLLMTRQFNFVWATTILSEHTFLNLTHILSAPMNIIGLPIPTMDDIVNSRIGTDSEILAKTRVSWAYFLLASILVYGVIPRVLLTVISSYIARRKKRSYQIDFSQPYYLDLQHKLDKITPSITDPDTEKTPQQSFVAPEPSPRKNTSIPDDIYWIGLELPEDVWPISKASKQNLGHITDRESLERCITMVNSNNSIQHLAIAVSAQRVPDRGIVRILNQLASTSEATWLALIWPLKSEGCSTKKELHLDTWQRAVNNSQLSLKNIVLVDQE